MTSDFLRASLKAVVGGKTATALAKALELHTVEDLLRHYPRRYVARSDLTEIATFVEGEQVTVVAEIARVTARRMRNRNGTILEATLTDGTDSFSITFFNQKWRERDLVPGRRGLFAGQIRRYRGKWQLAHPEFRLFADGIDTDPELIASFAGALVPIYPATSAVTTWQIQDSVALVLQGMGELPDPIPPEVLAARGLMSLSDALSRIHQPATRADSSAARERLRFEEAFTLQTVLALRRAAIGALPATRRAPAQSPLLDAFDARLPFALTAGQVDVGRQIDDDLSRDHPMHRLLQGDVGSGKTVVALRAMLRVVDAGGQAALLVPTEVLATQHWRSISALLGPLAEGGLLGGSELATRVALLTGSQRSVHRRRALLDVTSGDAGIVIGTHALIQDKVEFHDLALVVVDEQHRFGVEQRAALAAKSRDGSRPHVLVMTATPIPRTVAMTVFGDVDVSTLTELPAGRMPIATHVVPARQSPRLMSRVWERVTEEVGAGHRVFVVCPRIDENTDDDGAGSEHNMAEGAAITAEQMTAVVPFATRLADVELAGLRIGVLHGRLSSEEKDEVMGRFAGPDGPQAIDVLIATTVVEVGVDVPRATVMVIMDADCFGMSQLHQLRGRVGRGDAPGLCLLITTSEPGSLARERVDAVAATTDGFALSNLDLQMRKEGDVLGALQSGRLSSLRLLRVSHPEDADLIRQARDIAKNIVESDPQLRQHPPLAAAVNALREDEQADFLERA